MSYGDKMYEVEAIRKKKFIDGEPHYLIKWAGYPANQNTWEPIQHLEGVAWMVEEFEMPRKQKKRTTKRTTGRIAAFELPEMLPVDQSCQAWIPDIQDQYVSPSYEIVGESTAACIQYQKGHCEKGAKCPFRHEKSYEDDHTFDVEAIRKKKFIDGKPHLEGVAWMVKESEQARKQKKRTTKRTTGRIAAFELPEMLPVDKSCQAWIPDIQDQYASPSYEIVGESTAACIKYQKGHCEKGAKCPFRHEKLHMTPSD